MQRDIAWLFALLIMRTLTFRRTILAPFLGVLSLFIIPAVANVAVPAFPEAQGGGAASVGGRGGNVMLVTNLNDSGAGSLRACAVDASGPRTCVFRVGGIIEALSTLYITNPYLTIAGQTAPGGGITISGRNSTQHVLTVDTHDVIIRYMRIRRGASASGSGINFSVEGPAYNVIFDHNSVSWSYGDDNAGGDISRDTTVQPLNSETFSWNIIAEPFSTHPTGFVYSCENTTGNTWCDNVTDIDFHHNLLMSDSHRNPLVSFKTGRWVNNIVYNAGFYYTSIGAGVYLDAIGNHYVGGPLVATYWGDPNKVIHEFQVSERPCAGSDLNCPTGNPSLYLSGNIGPNQSNSAGDQWLMANMVSQANQPELGPVPRLYQRTSPLTATTYPITVDPVQNLDTVMLATLGDSRSLACNGAWVSNRDSVDTRLISEYQNNTGVLCVPWS